MKRASRLVARNIVIFLFIDTCFFSLSFSLRRGGLGAVVTYWVSFPVLLHIKQVKVLPLPTAKSSLETHTHTRAHTHTHTHTHTQHHSPFTVLIINFNWLELAVGSTNLVPGREELNSDTACWSRSADYEFVNNDNDNNNRDLCCAQTVEVYDSSRPLQHQIIHL